MLILILGGSGSGKSAFAEDVARTLSNNLLYIATMQPFGDEALSRIDRHVQMRQDKGFESVDCYTDLERMPYAKPYGAILLECLSNLLANELYAENASANLTDKKIINSVNFTLQQTQNLIIVSNDIGFDVNDYSDETVDYIQKLGNLNRRLSARADVVIEVVCGIPIYRKGKKTC